MKRLGLVFVALVFVNVLVVFYLLARPGGSFSDMLKPFVSDPQKEKTGFHYPGYNVILVGFDALRPDRTSMFGHRNDTTPNLARLAGESFLFRRAYAATTWTLPSFMSVFTGMYPSVNGVTNKWAIASPTQMVETRLNPTILTLPQLLKRKGYLLAGFTGDSGVHSRYGFGNDFDTYLDDRRFGGLDHSIPKALDWLRGHRDRPFFMFLHGYDCHGQYDPPAGYTRRYVQDYNGKLKGGKEEDAILREAGLKTALDPASLGEPRLYDMNEHDAQFYLALYDEKVRDADERFGQFVAQLKEMGLYDRTIIIAMSDHGDEFLEHGALDHGQSLYEELQRVMVMIHFPNQRKGRIIDEPICLLDLLPTALDSLEVPIPHKVDGISVLPVLSGGRLERRNFYCETDYRLFVHKRSVRNERYKLIYNLVTRKRELYDLQEDPRERDNIASSASRVAYEMEQDLMRWLKSMNTQVDAFVGRKEEFIKEF